MSDNKYESINVSDKTRGGMTLTSSDVQYISRMLSLQDETWNDAFDVNIVQLTKALAEVMKEQNDRMFAVLDEQTKMIKGIQCDINAIKSDIFDIKKRLDEIEDQVDEEENRLKVVETRLDNK